MAQTRGSITGSHVMLTGPVRGTVELEDGTVVDVTPTEVDVSHLSQEQVEEIAFHVGERYRVEGHPDDIEREDDGTLVQYEFEHVHDKKFDRLRDKRKSAGKKRKKD